MSGYREVVLKIPSRGYDSISRVAVTHCWTFVGALWKLCKEGFKVLREVERGDTLYRKTEHGFEPIDFGDCF